MIIRKLFLLFCFPAAFAHAQPYLIGDRTITFHDDARNRDVPTKVYYPGTAAGANSTVATGSFPVLVVGHGFVMSIDAYANLWQYFVPNGYIVVLANTETGFSPDHQTYGADLAFLVQALQAENSSSASPFFAHVAANSALIGHSMGGGAALLAAAGNVGIAAVVGLAPAETTPSAITAAASIQAPTLILAGSNDCVTPIAAHTAPMYAALTVPCRAFASISGGGHCYFAETNFNCSFGELTCSPSPTISRAAQHDIINDVAGPWLDHFLMGDAAALDDVLDSLEHSPRLVGEHTCSLTTGTREVEYSTWTVVPTLAGREVMLRNLPTNASVCIFDALGRAVLTTRRTESGMAIDTSAWPNGTYRITLQATSGMSTRAFAVLH